MAATAPAPSVVPDARSRRHRVQGPALLAVGVLGACVLLHLRDPHGAGSYGLCPWLVLTGTHCPGCGGLRAVNDLTHGDVVAAASSNLLFVASVPFVGLWWLRTMHDRWRGWLRVSRGSAPVVWTVVFAVATTAFAVARNLPAGSWLAP